MPANFLRVFLSDLAPHQDGCESPEAIVESARQTFAWFAQNQPAENGFVAESEIEAFAAWMVEAEADIVAAIRNDPWFTFPLEA